MCRAICAHRHVLLPSDAEYTVTIARGLMRKGEQVLRIRWLPGERVWQVCYVRGAPETVEPDDNEMEREYPEWYDIGEVGA